MKLIADLHLHSKYSRAVSPQMVPQEIVRWAKLKGINLVGTADWTHPLWFRELKSNLKEVSQGIFQLATNNLQSQDQEEVYFILSTEISSIYSQGGKTRRIHNLVLAPSFSTVEKINQSLLGRGANLLSDGRPIIGLSAKDLVQLVLGIDQECLVIPCHSWTPWFSLYGSQSGFDSIDECFGNLAKFIYGIETGLSSSPEMNWRIKELDNRTILSFSDAHSPAKLGREATVFKFKNQNSKIKMTNQDLKFSYKDIAGAIKKDLDANWEIASTIEFYPEEGKYHWTGHRKCSVKQSPEETKKLGAACPVCGKSLTVGVMHRVEDLASSSCQVLKKEKDGLVINFHPENKQPPYVMLIPLMEILSECLKSGTSSKGVINEFQKLVSYFKSEFDLLLKTDLGEIQKIAGERISQAIGKVRKGDIFIDPGYDGVFGKVKIWKDENVKQEEKKQMSLF